MNEFDAAFVLRWLTIAAAAVEREADRLTELDSAIGDADHGANMKRGFAAVTDALEKEPPTTPGAVLAAAGRKLISTVGGASGPLYGTLLRRTGKSLGEAPSVTRQELAVALTAGVAAVAQLGGAQVGDKTMLDALVPATEGSASPSRRPGTRPSVAPSRPYPSRRARAGRAIWASVPSDTRTPGPPRPRC